jgi:hypothetical protein
MIGLGAADLRKRGATELHISIDFPAVFAESVRATRESPRWVRAKPQAFPTWPGRRTRPKSSPSRSGHRRVAQRLAARRRSAPRVPDRVAARGCFPPGRALPVVQARRRVNFGRRSGVNFARRLTCEKAQEPSSEAGQVAPESDPRLNDENGVGAFAEVPEEVRPVRRRVVRQDHSPARQEAHQILTFRPSARGWAIDLRALAALSVIPVHSETPTVRMNTPLSLQIRARHACDADCLS